MYYSITEDGGMIGVGYGVEWCVVGLDREWSYNPRCRWPGPEAVTLSTIAGASRTVPALAG